jgi:5'-3' exonuclease
MASMLMLADTAGLYFRAFHAIPTTVTAPSGMPVNAIRGLLDMLANLVASRRPDELVACWDDDWRPGWRVALLPSYKSQRVAGPAASPGTGPFWVEEEPDELSPQVPLIADLLEAIGIPIIGAPGYEADDVIATIARAVGGPGRPVEVVTGDRDLLQVVCDAACIRVLYIGRGMARMQVFDEAEVLAGFNVRADQYADFAVLRGDPSDGLPGVPGIGPKTAAELLGRFGDLATLIAAATAGDTALRPAVANRLRDNLAYLAAAQPVVHAATVPVPAGPWPLPRSPRHPRRLADLSAAFGLAAPVGRLLHALADPRD